MSKKAADFQVQLVQLLTGGSMLGFVAVDINAGRLHRDVGDYPGQNHRMPVCCRVMRNAMTLADVVVAQPANGNGASLTIRYQLPRAT